MYLVFRSKAKLKTEVFLEIQAGLTKGFDLNVTDSIIDDNSGRGIWVSKQICNLYPISNKLIYKKLLVKC